MRGLLKLGQADSAPSIPTRSRESQSSGLGLGRGTWTNRLSPRNGFPSSPGSLRRARRPGAASSFRQELTLEAGPASLRGAQTQGSVLQIRLTVMGQPPRGLLLPAPPEAHCCSLLPQLPTVGCLESRTRPLLSVDIPSPKSWTSLVALKAIDVPMTLCSDLQTGPLPWTAGRRAPVCPLPLTKEHLSQDRRRKRWAYSPDPPLLCREVSVLSRPQGQLSLPLASVPIFWSAPRSLPLEEGPWPHPGVTVACLPDHLSAKT